MTDDSPGMKTAIVRQVGKLANSWPVLVALLLLMSVLAAAWVWDMQNVRRAMRELITDQLTWDRDFIATIMAKLESCNHRCQNNTDQ